MISVSKTIDFIRKDYASNPLRLFLEVYCWFANVAVALVFAFTVPNPPMLILYPIFLSGLAIGMYSALSRESFGLFATALTMFIIDCVGLARLILGLNV